MLKYLIKKYYGNVNLIKNNQVIYSMSNEISSQNWELSKYHILSKKKIVLNPFENQSSTNTNSDLPKLISLKEKGNVKFTQYFRKMGKIISSADEIFIEKGVVSGKETKVISSEKDSLHEIISLFDNVNSNGFKSEVTVLYLTKGELNVPGFIFVNANDKIILTNSKNVTALKEAIEKI